MPLGRGANLTPRKRRHSQAARRSATEMNQDLKPRRLGLCVSLAPVPWRRCPKGLPGERSGQGAAFKERGRRGCRAARDGFLSLHAARTLVSGRPRSWPGIWNDDDHDLQGQLSPVRRVVLGSTTAAFQGENPLSASEQQPGQTCPRQALGILTRHRSLALAALPPADPHSPLQGSALGCLRHALQPQQPLPPNLVLSPGCSLNNTLPPHLHRQLPSGCGNIPSRGSAHAYE